MPTEMESGFVTIDGDYLRMPFNGRSNEKDGYVGDGGNRNPSKVDGEGDMD